MQNFGGRKSWRIARDLSKCSCPKFSFLKAEVAIWCIASFLNSGSKLNSMLPFKNQHQILQTDRITSSQLASAILIKLLSYLCHVMLHPAASSRQPTSSSDQHSQIIYDGIMTKMWLSRDMGK